MLKSRVLVLSLILGVCLNAVAAPPSAIVVSPGDSQGWIERASNTGTIDVGVDDSYGGNGSLLLATDGSDGQIIKAARIPLITIGEITSISWELYTDNATNYPRPQLEYYALGGLFGTLVYEASNLTPSLGAWQGVSVNLSTDLFRDSRTGTVDTLANFQAGEVGPILMNFFQIGYGSTGGTFPPTNGNIDYVELNGTYWNFESVAALPPEPTLAPRSVPTMSQWALITMALLFGFVAFTRRRQVS